MTSQLLYGPAYEAIQKAGFEVADSIAGSPPESILWLERNDHRYKTLTDQWSENHDPLRLSVSSLDRAIGDAYESLIGPSSRLDALVRRQVVDQVLRSISEEGIIKDAHRFRDETLELIGAIEDHGHESPESYRTLIEDSTLTDRSAAFLQAISDQLNAELERSMIGDEFTQAEAYHRVLESERPLADLLPQADVIVVSGYFDLSPVQREILKRLSESLPVVILLPLVGPPENVGAADHVAAETATFYSSLVEETSRVTSNGPATLAEIAGGLYTATDPAVEPPPEETLRWVETPTPDREVRQVAKSIRNRLASDEIEPEDILVVVPGLISYREHIEDVFPAHGIDTVTFANKLLYQTYTGDAMLDLVAACEEEPGADRLARLATNPAVSLDGVDGSEITKLRRQLPTNDHGALLEELDDPSRSAFYELLDRTERAANAEGVETILELRELFEHIELEANAEAMSTDAETFDAAMERRAYKRVDRVLAAIERVARNRQLDDVLERVSNELDQIRVPPPREATTGAIEIVGPRDALMQSYDHLYVIGLTARDFPPNPERPRFFEDIEDGLAGIDPPSDRAIARYQFATMLASAESVYITTPETTANDEPLLESPVLDELARVTGLEPTDHELGHGDRESVQRAVSQVGAGWTASEAIETAIEAEVFDEERATRVRQGVTCAEHRADPARTAHDGQLASSTVEALHPQSYREPYSPTQVTQYARCGFQYYMERLLDIEPPEEYKLEPDPLDLGSLVHAIVEEFYSDLQSGPGDLVDLGAYHAEELEARMLAAGRRALDDLALPYTGAFFERWLYALFAGLANPEDNEYYHADDAGVDAPSEGLLARFVNAERDREDTPGWFEVAMDLTDDWDGQFDLELPDGRTIPIGGRIDRVAVNRFDEPATGLVHDYKTGSRSLRLTVDGIEFQLPLYALAAGQQLEADGIETPLDAAYYILDPPDEVSEKWTLRYYIGTYGDASDADYERFLDKNTPRRISDIVEGIEDGAFEPTVLDADTAKCRYCDYSEVCDVRYHQRREVIAGIDADVRPGYVPRYARADSLLDDFGGED